MTDLRQRFKHLDRVPVPDLRSDIRTRPPGVPPSQFPWSRLGTAALAFAVAAAGVAFAARAFFGERDRGETRQEPAPAPIDPRVTTTIKIGPQLNAVAAGEGSVWVLAQFPDPPHVRLMRIDPITNEVVAEVPIGGSGSELTVGLGSVWIPQYRQEAGALLFRIDASTNQMLAEIPGAGGSPLVAHGSVWAVGGRVGDDPPGSVVRIDPASNRVVAEIPLPFEPPPYDIVAGPTSIWVLGLNDHRGPDHPNLVRIDPETNKVVDAIDLDAGATSMTAGGGYVWFPGSAHDFEGLGTGSDDRGVVARVDEQTGAVLPDPIDFEAFRPFAFGEGGVWNVGWPTEQYGGICRLNASTLEVDSCVEPPSLAPAYSGVAALEPTTSTIWVIGDDGKVARIDLRPQGGSQPTTCPIEVAYAVAEPADDTSNVRLVLEDNTSVVSALDGVVTSIETSEGSGWAEVVVTSTDITVTYRFYLDAARGALPSEGTEVATGDLIGGAAELLDLAADAESQEVDLAATLDSWGCREGLVPTDSLTARMLDGSVWRVELAEPIEVAGAGRPSAYGELSVDGRVVADAARFDTRPELNRPFEPGFDPPVLLDEFVLPGGRRAEHWDLAPSHEEGTYAYGLWVEGPGEHVYFSSSQPIPEAELVVRSLRMREGGDRIEAIWFASERVDVVKLQAVFFLIDPQAPLRDPEVRLNAACRVGQDPQPSCEDVQLEVPVYTPGTEEALRGSTIKRIEP
jgi:hypothetical protein